MHPQPHHRLLHVIANQCAHWCGNPHPRRETWQTGTTLGKFVVLFRICPRRCFPLCCAARRTDCHVASLLAMTCRNLPGVCVCQRALPESVLAAAATPLPSACHCAPRPCTRAHVLPSACHCEPVRTLVWQSASPQGYLTSWQLLGRIRTSCGFALGTTLCHVLPQGERIATSLRSSQ